jgi:uncharacterized protein YifN (PemK superfamily)
MTKRRVRQNYKDFIEEMDKRNSSDKSPREEKNDCDKETIDKLISKINNNYERTYFDKNKLWQYCTKVDKDSITKISKAVNLGNAFSKAIPHGLEDAILYTTKYYTWLNQQ